VRYDDNTAANSLQQPSSRYPRGKAQETKMNASTITRDAFGAIIKGEALVQARALVALARGKVPAQYDDMRWGRSGKERGHRIGYACHHEIYDLNPEGTRALVCVREVEGTRYGVKTTSKEYFVIARHGLGVRVLPANKAVAAKAAKAAGETLGMAIEVALGKAKLPVKPAEIKTGYKLLVRGDDGFVSAWDGSAWQIGKARVEAASDNHTGGFYYYADLGEALEAAAANDVFGSAREHNRLAVVEVQASGRHYAHRAVHGTKLCATRVMPVREIASTI
jgi:hypothetical protein